jgi:hypothetical protein
MKTFPLVIIMAAALCGCSSQPTQSAAPEAAQPKAPETTTGNSAFFRCYSAARGWQADAQAFHAESVASKTRDGKAAEWRADFASPAKHVSRAFTWKNGDTEHGSDDTYSPTNESTMVFNFQALKTDTDKAFSVAQQHGGEKALEKNPDMAIFYVLDWNHLTNTLLWHVIYGPDRDDPVLRIAVNASTGEFSRVEK